MSFCRTFIVLKIKFIFIWKVVHQASFWNRGKKQLVNGLLVALGHKTSNNGTSFSPNPTAEGSIGKSMTQVIWIDVSAVELFCRNKWHCFHCTSSVKDFSSKSPANTCIPDYNYSHVKNIVNFYFQGKTHTKDTFRLFIKQASFFLLLQTLLTGRKNPGKSPRSNYFCNMLGPFGEFKSLTSFSLNNLAS